MLDFWHASGAFKLLFNLDDLWVGIFVGNSVGTPPAADILASVVLWFLADLRVGIFAGDLVGGPPVGFEVDLSGGETKADGFSDVACGLSI